MYKLWLTGVSRYRERNTEFQDGGHDDVMTHATWLEVAWGDLRRILEDCEVNLVPSRNVIDLRCCQMLRATLPCCVFAEIPITWRWSLTCVVVRCWVRHCHIVECWGRIGLIDWGHWRERSNTWEICNVNNFISTTFLSRIFSPGRENWN